MVQCPSLLTLVLSLAPQTTPTQQLGSSLHVSVGSSSSSRCRALDIRVCGTRRRAKFVIYINSLLYTSEAYPAGLESSDFREEAVAISLGLTALTALKDS